nr:HAMP domain-containing sensor histidine kinase [Novosphingobium fluoreni]
MEPLVVALNKLFARLEGAYDLEQAFTDDVAHELRTPLAAIRAQAQVLRRLAPQAVGQDVDRLTSTVDRANNLIDGMLMLARLNATAVASRSVDVHGLVAEVVADAMIEAGPDGIECSVVPEHIVRWQCDAALLQVALSAVIGNAIRHARCGGQLDIALARGSDQLAVSVGDRGPGIPAAERERLLRRFEHGALPTAGSGLGLSIASKAMTLLGGTIRLEERQDGHGLLAVLTLRSQAS